MSRPRAASSGAALRAASASGAALRAASAAPAFYVPFAAALLAFALYAFTSAPDLLWSDSSKHLILVARGEVLGFGHGRHPLHTLLGMVAALLPLPLPRTQNLLSAACGALAVGFAAAAARRFARPGAALLAAAALALAHTVWLYSVVNETYSLLWALVALLVLLAVRHREQPSAQRLAALALVAGLAVSAHGIAALAFPGILILAAANVPPLRSLAAAAAAFAAGSVLVWLPSGGPASQPAARESLGFLASTLSHAHLFLDPAKLPRELALFPAYLAFELPGLASVALGWGALRGLRRDRARTVALILAAAPIVLFASGYMRQRQFAMLGAAYVLLVPLLAAGLDPLLAGRGRAALALVTAAIVVVPPATYALAARAASAYGFPFPVRTLPFRDEAHYFLWPPKRDALGARRYVSAAAELPPGSTVLGDFNALEPLRYAVEVEGSLRLELRQVVDDAVLAGRDPAVDLGRAAEEELARGRQVFLADRHEPYYRLTQLRERFELSDVGPFVRVSLRRSR